MSAISNDNWVGRLWAITASMVEESLKTASGLAPGEPHVSTKDDQLQLRMTMTKIETGRQGENSGEADKNLPTELRRIKTLENLAVYKGNKPDGNGITPQQKAKASWEIYLAAVDDRLNNIEKEAVAAFTANPMGSRAPEGGDQKEQIKYNKKFQDAVWVLDHLSDEASPKYAPGLGYFEGRGSDGHIGKFSQEVIEQIKADLMAGKFAEWKPDADLENISNALVMEIVINIADSRISSETASSIQSAGNAVSSYSLPW